MTIHLANGNRELAQILKANAGKVVLLDFYADFCGPCKAIAPGLERLGKTPNVVLIKIDVESDGNKDTVNDFAIKAMPTIIWIVGNQSVNRLEGANLKEIQRITAGLASSDF
jgi:thioredoxin 1